MRHVTDDERRARLAVRHALAKDARVDSPEAATRAMTVLHATEPATVYLSCLARVADLKLADVDRALYDDRSLVKQLAMRRTLFVFPRELLPAVWPSASARVARFERSRMAKEVVQFGFGDDGDEWIDRARAEVLAVLKDLPEGRSPVEIREAIPMLNVKGERAGVTIWAGAGVLTQLGATGDIVRADATGHWRTSRWRWTLTQHWLGEVPAWWDAADGYREIVRRWLYTFGPGTEDDLVWWLGGTKTVVRAALAELSAVEVSLDDGGTGWLLPDDLEEVAEPETWVSLLPVLDPTIMGWRHRDFYLGGHREQIFDDRGNAGTTAWVNGRVVGCWLQDDAGVVSVHLLEKVSAQARKALNAEAARLTAWLDGLRIGTIYPSAAMKSVGT